MSGYLHRLAEERSLALHREVAARLQEDPGLLDAARQRVAAWPDQGVHPAYVDAWTTLLDGDPAELDRVLTDPGERFRALRQSTPFAGVVDARRRWQIWKQVRSTFTERGIVASSSTCCAPPRRSPTSGSSW